ncbi:uracil permease [Miniphocaeibacter massiliensis]|uniref:uracil permease n=1 Tax=Miniphocaeibacter massiliensis TaxID=2041841 RepID=UPI000C079A8B|nr:uracil permease [Miniphocaeibacter massiliensis]
MSRKIIKVDEKVPFRMWIPLSLQHTFAMFGASVLVPIVLKFNPGIVLLMNGIGTLLFILITKKKAPAYLGSSFAFLGPAGIVISKLGPEYAQGGFVAIGILGCLLAFIIYKFGTDWINVVLPSAAMGAVVSLIGFELASSTVKGGKIGAEIMTENVNFEHVLVFAVTLSVAIIGSVVFKKFLATIPILIAIVTGYIVAYAVGLVDLTPVMEAKLFTLPEFRLAKFDVSAILTMLPVILVITSEHISHQVVTSNIIGRNLIKDPGLHRSIFADNFSTALSGLIGGVPTTTYGENIGVMAVTGVYSIYVIAGAALISILMAFIGPLAAFIQTIPGDVIGGVTFLLYGMIGASGIRLLVDERVDYSKSKNLILTSVIFVTGLSGLAINIGDVELKGMVLSSIVAVVLSLLFYIFDRLGLMNQ